MLAFDTGPGNMVIDRLAHRVTGGRRRYDADGRLARRGQVHTGCCAQLLKHPFLGQPPAEDHRQGDFRGAFRRCALRPRKGQGHRPMDILATVTAFTAESIASAYRRFLPGRRDEVILCGGGAQNRCLGRDAAAGAWPRRRSVPMDELGINADAKEALSFAILAAAAIRGQANNVPSATGARGAVVCGKIVPGRTSQ